MNLDQWAKLRERKKNREIIHDTSKEPNETTIVRPESNQAETDLYYSGPPVDSTKRRKKCQ
jgi:hypothetical protein